MKYSKRIIIILSLCFCLAITSACTKKEALSASEFQDKMEDVGYTVQDVTDLHDAETNSGVYIAIKQDIEISFYVLNSEENAQNFYNITKKKEIEIDKKVRKTEKVDGSYAKLTLTDKNKYLAMIRSEKTVLTVSTTGKNKKEVESIIRKLGY